MASSNANAKAPLSIKGANAPLLATPAVKAFAVNLDWLRYTTPYDSALQSADNLRRAIPDHEAYWLTGEMLPNGKGYDSAMRLSIGVIHWHTKLASQGISVELSGAALKQSRDASWSDIDMLRHIEQVGGKVSTMDSAIDVYNCDAHFGDIIALDELGSLETTAHIVNEFKGRRTSKGETIPHGGVYIGSPKSPRQIKVYNKAAEQGLDGVDWTRIEMRWRGKHARAAHQAMLKFGVAEVTRKAIRQMCNADAEWYQDALHGDLAEIEPVRRPETNTVDWLIDFVAPILERHLMAERAQGATRLFKRFDDILRTEYNQRGKDKASRALHGPRAFAKLDK